jgi:hypothetical protein
MWWYGKLQPLSNTPYLDKVGQFGMDLRRLYMPIDSISTPPLRTLQQLYGGSGTTNFLQKQQERQTGNQAKESWRPLMNESASLSPSMHLTTVA